MIDIIDRLRRTGASGWTDAVHVGTDLELEAADVIEQLRDLINKQHEVIVSSSKVIGSLLDLKDEDDD